MQLRPTPILYGQRSCGAAAAMSSALCVVLLAGCAPVDDLGRQPQPDDGGLQEDDEREEADDLSQAAIRAMNAGLVPSGIVDDQLEACVSASAAAAELSGANEFVFHGTVDVRGPRPTYRADPADALVLREPAADTRYTITELLVSPVNDLSEVFLHDHAIECHASRDDAFDLALRSQQEGSSGEGSATGSIGRTDDALLVSLVEQRQAATEIENNFVRYDVVTDLTGSARGPGVDIGFTEREHDLLVLTTDAFENETTTLSLSGRVDDATFSLADGIIRRSFTNGAPAEPDFWAETSGNLQRDGTPFGRLSFQTGLVGEFLILLSMPEQTEVLEQHAP